VKEEQVDYSGNCGNMLAAIGPFAVDEGLVIVHGSRACVRIFNTNTRKIIHSTFPVEGGYACYSGDFTMPGVPGTGAAVRLDFIDPAGASTGRLLPTGHTKDVIAVPAFGKLEVSMVDAGSACAFVRAKDVGLNGNELPEAVARAPAILEKLQAIRTVASIAMGITTDAKLARVTSVPHIAFVSESADALSLSGEAIDKKQMDLTVRIISNGQPHRALPLTASLCTAVAAKIQGTVVQEMLRSNSDPRSPIRLGMPSGVLPLGADVEAAGSGWVVRRGIFYRTARRLFDGRVYLSGRLGCSRHYLS
jgi:2-methylaconitate isomerase